MRRRPVLRRIADPALAAYLLTRGCVLRGTEGPPKRRSLVFENVTPEAIHDFYHANAPAPARGLFDAWRSVRVLLAEGLEFYRITQRRGEPGGARLDRRTEGAND